MTMEKVGTPGEEGRDAGRRVGAGSGMAGGAAERYAGA